MDQSKQTSLYELHEMLGAKFISFAGYLMPVQYTRGVLQEHLHTRKHAGFFDISHMGQITVWPRNCSKEELIRNLERLMPCDLQSLPVNRQCYSMFTNVDGGVIDDIIVANCETHFHLIVNASQKYSDLDHLQNNLSDKCEVQLENEKSLIAIQGPLSQDILSEFCPEIMYMKFMDNKQVNIFDVPCLISRSGYTGEDGFEISIQNDKILELTEKLLQNEHLQPIGLGARDSLRLEAGLCLYGNDLNVDITPPEADLKWAIHKSRINDHSKPTPFLGSEQILMQLREGVKFIRVGLLPSGKAPMRQGAEIFADPLGNQHIGTITSGGFAPTLNQPISMARINKQFSKVGTEIYVKIREKVLPATIVGLPFVSTKYKKT